MQLHPPTGEIYVVGENGIYEELEAVGLHCHGKEDEHETDVAVLASMNPAISTVVVGLDRKINYIKMSRAAAYIRDFGCSFIATNLDAAFPNAGGIISGGSGCIVSAISTICGKQPEVVIGKPSRSFIDLVLDSHPGIKLSEMLMVGDRLDTDIHFAQRCHIPSLCVLTGFATEDSIFKVEDALAPTWYTASVSDIKSVLCGENPF